MSTACKEIMMSTDANLCESSSHRHTTTRAALDVVPEEREKKKHYTS